MSLTEARVYRHNLEAAYRFLDDRGFMLSEHSQDDYADTVEALDEYIKGAAQSEN